MYAIHANSKLVEKPTCALESPIDGRVRRLKLLLALGPSRGARERLRPILVQRLALVAEPIADPQRAGQTHLHATHTRVRQYSYALTEPITFDYVQVSSSARRAVCIQWALLSLSGAATR